eukprot:3263080-Rhodomonas_salina.1
MTRQYRACVAPIRRSVAPFARSVPGAAYHTLDQYRTPDQYRARHTTTCHVRNTPAAPSTGTKGYTSCVRSHMLGHGDAAKPRNQIFRTAQVASCP